LDRSGTVTFLFTDIEGSTRLLQQLGDAWPATLERHRQLIREAIAEHGGEELGTEGDSFFVVFPTASGALSAVVAAQRQLHAEPWPGEHPLRVRMGLHTGEAERVHDTYSGLEVHRAARIAAAGHGGQVIVSDATRVLLGAGLPAGIGFRDLGTHRLKDLPDAEHLQQLVIEGLPRDFPPIRTVEATPNNLPVQLTSFLGRQREIAEVSALLEHNRLLTLTGPGGTGKTRLSLAVASRVMERFPDGVFFVPLAPLHEVELVAPTIAHELGLGDRGGREPEERIIDLIGSKRMLLVLDNFEQIVPAAPLVNTLLRRAPNLSVLVSSRESLHLYGEQEYPVPPLGTPPLPDAANPTATDAEAVSQYEAVALFIDRASSVKPGFRVTNENAPAVAELCVLLDGLPLAIELAAARVRILAPDAILRRLGDRLDLLSGGGSDRPERQQTLRGAIAWSHDLLDGRERRLFAALSVFVGGATFEAIEEICAPLVEGDLFDALTSLVEKSLVRELSVNDDVRFSQLHVIREYAHERAEELGFGGDLRQRHADYFARLAAEARAVIMGSDKRAWLDRLELEHDNLRAALMWATDARDGGRALELAANLWRFWQMRGYLIEGLERVRQALAIPPSSETDAARRSALEAAGGLAYWQGDLEAAERYYTDALDAQRVAGDDRGIADALYNLSFVYSIPSGRGLQLADVDRSRELVAESLEIYRRINDRPGTARALWSMSNSAWMADDIEAGEAYSLEALDTFRDIDDRFMVGWSLYTLSMLRMQARRLAEVGGPLRESLAIFNEAGDISGYVLVLDGLAAEAYLSGDLDRAARLVGAVEHLQETSGTGLTVANRELIGFSHDPLVAEPRLADAIAEGRRLAPAEAVAYGLEPVRATA
jgi:predicted ATPase/class 3 adenylate cyclase